MAKAKKIDAATDMQKTFEEQNARVTAKVEEAAEFAKGNFDAMMASAEKVSESAQVITTTMLQFAKDAVDQNFAVLKELGQTKDASEFVEKQTAFAKTSVEGLVQQTQKINEMTIAAVKDCAEPVNARVADVSETMRSGFAKV
ncbi:MAG: phasin family protein [Pseudomonadota bacterium]